MNPDSIYRKVFERPGHALGMASIAHPMSIALACACGFQDTWWPHEDRNDVARRFNEHLRPR